MAGPRGIPQRHVYVPDASTARVDQARVDLAQSLSLFPLLRGRIVSVTFATGGAMQIVRHDLGVAAACIVVRWNYAPGMAGPTFAEWVPQPAGIDPTIQIALVASAACTVDLWFYPRASRPIVASLGQST